MTDGRQLEYLLAVERLELEAAAAQCAGCGGLVRNTEPYEIVLAGVEYGPVVYTHVGCLDAFDRKLGEGRR